MSEFHGYGAGDDPWAPGDGGEPPAAWSGEADPFARLHALLDRLRDRPTGRLSRQLRRLRLRSEQLARRDPASVPNVFAPGVASSAAAAPKRGHSRRQLRGDRLLISLLLAGGMLLPFSNVWARLGESAPAEFAAAGEQQALFAALDALEPDALVLVGMEYGPTAAGELDTLARVLLRHILLRRARPVVVSRYPVTLLRAEDMLTRLGEADSALLQQLQDQDPLRANEDWYVTRFLAGDMAGLRALTMNLDRQLARDLRGAVTGLAVDGLADFAQVLVIAERPEDLRQWSEQIAPLAERGLLGAVGQAAAPLTRPWLEVSLAGMVSGFRDALTYDAQLRGLAPAATVEVTLQGPATAPGVRILGIQDMPTEEAAAGVPVEAPAQPDDNQVVPTAAGTATILLGRVRDDIGIRSLYRFADAASAEVGKVSPGDTLLVLQRIRVAGDWLFVQTNGGLRGWLERASMDLDAADLDAVALQEAVEPASPTPTLTPTPTATLTPTPTATVTPATPAPTTTGTIVAPSPSPAPVPASGTIAQAEEREAAIHIGLALSITLIALGALGNVGRAAVRRRRG